ncbi:MAG: corrinoid protein [Caldilineaceae bacterium]
MENSTILQDLKQAVVDGDYRDAVDLTTELLERGAAPGQILNEGLIAGMNVVGDRFKTGACFVPEMLIAARAMQRALDVLRPALVDTGVEPMGTVVLGTVRGDLHDIGKNLASMFLEGVGFRVIDVGVDAPAEKFVEAVRENRPQILGMSALLTTTMSYAAEVIKALEQADLRQKVKVIIGGAPVTAEWAARIGADAFAVDAATGADRCKELIQGSAL